LSEDEVHFIERSRSAYVRVGSKVEVTGAGGPPQLFTLHEGWAVRYVRLPGGGRQVLDALLPGDVIGATDLLLGTVGERAERVETVTAASLCRLSGLTVDGLFAELPALAAAFGRVAARQARRAESLMAALGQKDAVERTAFLLADIHARLEDRRMTQGNWAPFPLRRHHLADALGLSGTHVTRTLAELEQRGLARVGGGALLVLDRGALEALGGYEPSDEVVTLL
jgi:CRP/FNR family transcriptional regulator, anaerobic regulatory protein